MKVRVEEEVNNNQIPEHGDIVYDTISNVFGVVISGENGLTAIRLDNGYDWFGLHLITQEKIKRGYLKLYKSNEYETTLKKSINIDVFLSIKKKQRKLNPKPGDIVYDPYFNHYFIITSKKSIADSFNTISLNGLIYAHTSNNYITKQNHILYKSSEYELILRRKS